MRRPDSLTAAHRPGPACAARRSAILGLLAFGALCGATVAGAQAAPDSAKAVRVRRLLEVTGSAALIASELERSLAVERERTTNLPAGFWEVMERRVREEIPSLFEDLVRIYDRHFSREEIDAFVAFYETPAGRHLAADQDEILAESRQAGERWGQRLGTEVAQQWAQVVPYEPPAGSDVFAVAQGSWDWRNRGDSTCVVDPHTIAFSSDRRTMTLTSRKPFKQMGGRMGTVTTYEVRGSTRSSVRGFITGETRRTDGGQAVVWDLVLTGPDSYRWHRTDWEEGAYTDEIVRCPLRER
jgi:hypothetical protein